MSEEQAKRKAEQDAAAAAELEPKTPDEHAARFRKSLDAAAASGTTSLLVYVARLPREGRTTTEVALPGLTEADVANAVGGLLQLAMASGGLAPAAAVKILGRAMEIAEAQRRAAQGPPFAGPASPGLLVPGRN